MAPPNTTARTIIRQLTFRVLDHHFAELLFLVPKQLDRISLNFTCWRQPHSHALFLSPTEQLRLAINSARFLLSLHICSVLKTKVDFAIWLILFRLIYMTIGKLHVCWNPQSFLVLSFSRKASFNSPALKLITPLHGSLLVGNLLRSAKKWLYRPIHHPFRKLKTSTENLWAGWALNTLNTLEVEVGIVNARNLVQHCN